VRQKSIKINKSLFITKQASIYKQSAHEGGKVVSQTHRTPLPQDIPLERISVKGWVDPRAITWPEKLCSWKILITPSGIERATSRLEVQCLKKTFHHTNIEKKLKATLQTLKHYSHYRSALWIRFLHI